MRDEFNNEEVKYFTNHLNQQIKVVPLELFPILSKAHKLELCFYDCKNHLKSIGHLSCEGVLYLASTIKRMYNTNEWGDGGFKSDPKHTTNFKGHIFYIDNFRLCARSSSNSEIEDSIANLYFGEGEKSIFNFIKKNRFGKTEVVTWTAETYGCGPILRYPGSIRAERRREIF